MKSSALKNNLQVAKVLVLAAIFAFGIQFVSAQAPWRAPTANPPGDNTYAPLNTSRAGQVKEGGITLGQSALPADTSLNIPNGKIILRPGGSPGSSGQVLKTDGSGNTFWGNDSTGSGGGMSCTGPGCTDARLARFNAGGVTNANIFDNGSTVEIMSNIGRFVVWPQIEIRGGSPGVGKVLTSDATGLATWQASASSARVTFGPETFGPDGSISHCPSGHIAVGIDCTGTCGGDSHRAICRQMLINGTPVSW